MDNYICHAQGYANDPSTVPFDIEWDSGCGYPGDQTAALYNAYENTPDGYSLIGYSIETCDGVTSAAAATTDKPEGAQAQPAAENLKPGMWQLVGSKGQEKAVRTESRQINNAKDMNGFLKDFYAQRPAIDKVTASKLAD
ncbi:hypothetical protein SV7mr_15350 [Stieleria bergensis]|uniref:Uncharacterized protein n=1 Tax=Stieleria bergensis TaxID=2528025 RepID=A0A517SSC8_9BACT|nr:hypothetical protein SV7mr_15350 [Planctomycetes bacterium SV_7m_r]